ncbi:MAG: carboxypeptidase-like regulatory domain-containing protein [Lautropia sp.]|nr:carboxypeptidase-like regulatory domain-containing protein [Lautropia sp.]
MRLELDLLGMPTDLGVERIKIVEGKDLVEDLTVVDGEIRFITPADRGKTGTIRLVIEGNTTRRPLEIALGSPRFLEIADTSEFNDDDLDRAPIPLKVHGLGPGNRIGHEGLTFEIDREIEIHPVASNAMIAAGGGDPLFLRKLWQPLPSKRGFSLSHDVLKTLIARQDGSDIWAEVVFNGNGKDYDFSRKWSFVMHVPVASIEGQLIDSSTKQAVRELAGRKLAIRGQRSNGTRAVTVIDDEGRFRLDDLSAGTYIAEVLDTQLPGFIQTLFHVRQDDTRVQVSLPYSTRAYKALTRKNIEDGKDGNILGKPTPKQTNSTPSKTVQERPITESTCPDGFRNHSVYAADMQRSVLVCLP